MPSNTTNIASASLSVSLACEVAAAGCFLSAEAVPPGGDGVLSTAELKELLLTHSAPAPLPPAWTFLGRSDVIRQIRCPPAELALTLQNEYPVNRLLSSRLLVRAANGQLCLSPVLGDERSKFMMILDSKQNLTEVVSARGAMISSDPPFFRCGVRPKNQRRPRRVYLASSDDDLQVLHCLGFTVTTMAGLAELNARQVRRLLGKPPAGSLNLTPMTLVGWNVGAIDHTMPKELAKELQCIWDIESAFGYHPLMMPFRFWQPTDTQFDQIRAANRFRGRNLVRNAFLESIDASTIPAADAWDTLREQVDVDLATAYSKLQQVIDGSHFIPKSAAAQTALRRYMAAVDRKTGERFLAAAGASPDPLEAALWIAAREVFDDLTKYLSINTSAKQVIDNQCPTPTNLTTEAVAERKQLIDLLLKMQKAIGRNN